MLLIIGELLSRKCLNKGQILGLGENMICLFWRQYNSSGSPVLIELNSTKETRATWEILLFRLWGLCVMQPPSKNFKKKQRIISFTVFFLNLRLCRFAFQRPVPQGGWGGGGLMQGKVAQSRQLGRHSLKWTIHMLRFESWLHYHIFNNTSIQNRLKSHQDNRTIISLGNI